ncbi:MAG: PAS domain-containing sensor histidine kinase [Ignavibacterium sp.]|nr:PAS domain-containing sensor histidine kinase [Ignavibacterium sp.]MDW8376233.1 PAS domain-containing sensor histidine kinase [Ignavibacteriales bacterium]
MDVFDKELTDKSEKVTTNQNEKIEYIYSNFFDLSQELLILLDNRGYIKDVNAQGAKHLEYSKEELLGMHINELIDPNYLKEFANNFDKVIRSQKGNFRTNLQSKIGFSQQYNLNFQTISSDSKINYVLISGINIDEIKRYEKEILELYPRLQELERILQIENQRAFVPKFILKELEKLRSTFISNISHELRTPLASIIGFAENINSDPSLPPELIKEFTQIILNEAKRLTRLVNNILDLSMIQQGKFLINKSKFDLVKGIRAVIDEFSNIAAEKNITINFETNKEEIEIEADESRIMRAIASIIHNAIKFNENYGRVFVQVKVLFKEIDIVIVDTGIGINPDEIPNIFMKLTDEKIVFSETNIAGFSLVYAKTIIELHKGILDIQSELNKGTTVLIKLPKQSF